MKHNYNATIDFYIIYINACGKVKPQSEAIPSLAKTDI